MAANKNTSRSGHWRYAKGQPRSRTYNSWASMKRRCSNKKDKNYAIYGGRGIMVCDRWKYFDNFLADMGERPEGKTLDRIDGRKGYFPANCRWADPIIQANNLTVDRRQPRGSYKVFLTAFGETKGFTAWLKDPRCVVGEGTLLARLRRYGWSHEKAIAEPISEVKRYAAKCAKLKRWPGRSCGK
jgi:hypothetical protein